MVLELRAFLDGYQGGSYFNHTIPNGTYKERFMKSERIYHLYPLGFTGANQTINDGKVVKPLSSIIEMIPHMQLMNTTILLLGPVFESETHGYDTVDYTQVDRRLGSNDDLRGLVTACHEAGIKVMLDCVFNHIARGHWIFQDVRSNRDRSAYKDWLKDLDFNSNSANNDGFSYAHWDGHEHLVKLNLDKPEVQQYLCDLALGWVHSYKIDGLRMDAADVMSKKFLAKLSGTLKTEKPGFKMLGEVVHGNYNEWLEEGGLDAVTNYETYKGLYSSLNDANYYEIAYALNRQFGQGGIYPSGAMVNFVDNHDVTRVASNLKDKSQLYPLYIMLYTMPGVPAIYYGSEYGVEGEKANHTDAPLRPDWQWIEAKGETAIWATIQKLSKIHQGSLAIREGGYQQVHIDHQIIAYKRQWSGQDVYVFINAQKEPATIPTPMVHGDFYDLLNEEDYHSKGHVDIYGNWGRILVRKN